MIFFNVSHLRSLLYSKYSKRSIFHSEWKLQFFQDPPDLHELVLRVSLRPPPTTLSWLALLQPLYLPCSTPYILASIRLLQSLCPCGFLGWGQSFPRFTLSLTWRLCSHSYCVRFPWIPVVTSCLILLCHLMVSHFPSYHYHHPKCYICIFSVCNNEEYLENKDFI